MSTQKPGIFVRMFYGQFLGGILKGLVYALVLLGITTFYQANALPDNPGLLYGVAITLGILLILTSFILTVAYEDELGGFETYEAGDIIFGGFLSGAVWFLYLCWIVAAIGQQVLESRRLIQFGLVGAVLIVGIISYLRYQNGKKRKEVAEARKAHEQNVNPGPTLTSYRDIYPGSGGSDYPIIPTDKDTRL